MSDTAQMSDASRGSHAKIGITFRYTLAYLRHYFFRRDWLLIPLFVLIGLQTVSYVGSFLLLAASLRTMVAGGELSFSGFVIPGLTTQVAGLAGIALLGASVILRVAALTVAIRTGTKFGASIVYSLRDKWDDLSVAQRRYVFNLGGLAAFLSRLVVIALVPTAMFVAGLAVLTMIDIVIAGALLLVGVLALFAFVPANLLDARDKRPPFDPNISGLELVEQRHKVEKAIGARLKQYRARQLIGSVNLFLFFMALASVPMFVDIDWAVEHYAETIVLILLIGRSSILSLTNIAIMMRLIGVNEEGVINIMGILDNGVAPEAGKVVAKDEDAE